MTRMQEAPIPGETEGERVLRIKAALDRIEKRPEEKQRRHELGLDRPEANLAIPHVSKLTMSEEEREALRTPLLTIEEELAEATGTTVHETIERIFTMDEDQAAFAKHGHIDGYSIGGEDLPRAFPLSIAIKRLSGTATIPTQGKASDAGYDLYADQSATIYAGTRSMIDTGIALAIPEGYVGYIKPRSGLAWKSGIQVLGGVIDAGYRGEVRVILLNTAASGNFNISRGDRIAQLVIEHIPTVEYVEVEELPESERGQGGFGSTGTR